ncbi:MAG: thiamine-phosphate kinase [Thaumarchaeota archaeon]|nr:thiamine-phosphate kinase [Nitrososphaerota archaeon]
MDELEIIRLMKTMAGKPPDGWLSIGDDVAVLRGRRAGVVLKSDMLVGKTDVPPGMTWRQAGRKSVAACVSDFAAKGVSPEALMVSIGIPRSLSDADIRSLIKGFGDGMKEWGVRLVGGDTNEADDVVVDCVLVGFSDRVVKRSGAKPGELIAVTGDFGRTSAGLKILLDGAKPDPKFRKSALASVYMPSPRLALGIKLAGRLSSSMDSSDGLAVCLHTIARMSGVGMRIDRLPCDVPSMERFAETNGYSVEDLVLYGGEEYEIVATVEKAGIKGAQAIASSMGEKLTVIGETTEPPSIVTMGGRSLRDEGWVHLA